MYILLKKKENKSYTIKTIEARQQTSLQRKLNQTHSKIRVTYQLSIWISIYNAPTRLSLHIDITYVLLDRQIRYNDQDSEPLILPTHYIQNHLVQKIKMSIEIMLCDLSLVYSFIITNTEGNNHNPFMFYQQVPDTGR